MKPIAILLLWLPWAAAAQIRPNFSGTWDLALDQSDFGKIPKPKKATDVIEHKGIHVQVKSTLVLPQGEFSTESQYTTNGVENLNKEQTGAVIKSTSRWVGRQLVTEAHVDAGKTTVHYTEKWSLGAAGKTLINDRVIKSNRGDLAQKLVYVKRAVLPVVKK